METVIEKTCEVEAAPDDVWQRIATPQGINAELKPWLRMTIPRRARGLTIDEVPTGVKLGRSLVLAFGVLPVEYDDLQLAEVETGRRFREVSSTLALKRWQHERLLEPVPQGTRVTDRLSFELRRPLSLIPGTHTATARIIWALFAHRHRKLVAYFASAQRLR